MAGIPSPNMENVNMLVNNLVNNASGIMDEVLPSLQQAAGLHQLLETILRRMNEVDQTMGRRMDRLEERMTTLEQSVPMIAVNLLMHFEANNVARYLNTGLGHPRAPLERIVSTRTGLVAHNFPANVDAFYGMGLSELDGLLSYYGLLTHGNIVVRQMRLRAYFGIPW